MKKETKAQKNLKIVVIILCFIILTILGAYAYFFFFDESIPSFLNKYARVIGLFGIGIIALILPYVGGKMYSGDNKGDLLMKIVGIFLIVTAIILLIIEIF